MMDEVGDSKAEDSQPQRALWMRPLPTPAPAATPTAVAPAVPTELPLVRLPASQLVAGLPGAPRPRRRGRVVHQILHRFSLSDWICWALAFVVVRIC